MPLHQMCERVSSPWSAAEPSDSGSPRYAPPAKQTVCTVDVSGRPRAAAVVYTTAHAPGIRDGIGSTRVDPGCA
jgi:hypothetical protein